MKSTIDNYINNVQYFPPLQNILTDRNLIFAVTFEENSRGEFLTDIFDIITGKHLASAYMPEVVADFSADIRSGYLFAIIKKPDSFPIVEKYRIDPAVYGK